MSLPTSHKHQSATLFLSQQTGPFAFEAIKEANPDCIVERIPGGVSCRPRTRIGINELEDAKRLRGLRISQIIIDDLDMVHYPNESNGFE